MQYSSWTGWRVSQLYQGSFPHTRVSQLYQGAFPQGCSLYARLHARLPSRPNALAEDCVEHCARGIHLLSRPPAYLPAQTHSRRIVSSTAVVASTLSGSPSCGGILTSSPAQGCECGHTGMHAHG
eukprot:364304-Chlamydomonas_euryale.AAC.5